MRFSRDISLTDWLCFSPVPFISIAAEMWRGMRDCGEALSAIGKAHSNDTVSALGVSTPFVDLLWSMYGRF